MNAKTAQLRAKFRIVTEDRIARLRDVLERLADPETRDEAHRDLGRELHTLKGEARLLGFPAIASLAHAMEDVVKHHRTEPSEVVALVQRGLDAVLVLLQGAADERSGEHDPRLTERALAAWLADPARRAPTESAKHGSKAADSAREPADTSSGARGASKSLGRLVRVSMDDLDVVSSVISKLSTGRARTLAHLAGLEQRAKSLHSLLNETLDSHAAQLNGSSKLLDNAIRELRHVANALMDAERDADAQLDELSETLCAMRLQPLRLIFDTYASFVRSAAQQAG